jgi:phosphatidylserine/phosphatidylglycerophosphate/cardiolipin synthase-like enzyme
VRLITDDDQMESAGSDIQDLVKHGIPALHDNNHQAHMHHKFAVIDGKTLLNGELQHRFIKAVIASFHGVRLRDAGCVNSVLRRLS